MVLLSREKFARLRGVTIGQGCRIYIRQWGSEPFLISIGDRVTVTSGVMFITHDGSSWLVRKPDGQRYYHYAPITVEDDVFIGIGSIILPGVTIGSRSVVAAGSVVTRSVPPGSVVAGNPARIIGSFDSFAEKVRSKYVDGDLIDGIADYRQRIYAAIEIEADTPSAPLP